MTKSELIERIVTHQGQLSSKDVELAIKTMLEQMAQALATGDRIEIRGFGSFSLHYRAPRVGRNPKTGQSVSLDGKFVPHFKPGKELRDRVNEDEEEGGDDDIEIDSDGDDDFEIDSDGHCVPVEFMEDRRRQQMGASYSNDDDGDYDPDFYIDEDGHAVPY